LLDVGEHGPRAEPKQLRAPGLATDDGTDLGALRRREFGEVVPDPARSAGQQHPLAGEWSDDAGESQRGEARQGKRRGDLRGNVVGQYGESIGRYRNAFGPAAALRMTDHALTACRPDAGGGLLDDGAGDVLARTPVHRRRLEEERLAAVDRVGLDRNDNLMVGRRRFGHLAEHDRSGDRDHCSHRSSSGWARDARAVGARLRFDSDHDS
jgi:hypothetical protein